MYVHLHLEVVHLIATSIFFPFWYYMHVNKCCYNKWWVDILPYIGCCTMRHENMILQQYSSYCDIYLSFFIITYYVQRLKIILLYYYNFHISHCLFLWYSKVKCVALVFVGELHQHWRGCGGPPGTVAEGVYSECRPRKGPRYESPVWEFSTFIVLVLNFCSIL